jgi:hypothetical protein
VVPPLNAWLIWLEVNVTVLLEPGVTLTVEPMPCQFPFSSSSTETDVAFNDALVQLKLTDSLLIAVTCKFVGGNVGTTAEVTDDGLELPVGSLAKTR